MAYRLYDYVLPDGINDIRAWTAGLQVVERAKLNEKFDMLALHGEALLPHVLTESGEPGIRKLRVQGPTKLRPLLCRGPCDVGTEYTFLAGAREVQSKWKPKGILAVAKKRKSDVVADPDGRRRKHERVG